MTALILIRIWIHVRCGAVIVRSPFFSLFSLFSFFLSFFLSVFSTEESFRLVSTRSWSICLFWSLSFRVCSLLLCYLFVVRCSIEYTYICTYPSPKAILTRSIANSNSGDAPGALQQATNSKQEQEREHEHEARELRSEELGKPGKIDT